MTGLPGRRWLVWAVALTTFLQLHSSVLPALRTSTGQRPDPATLRSDLDTIFADPVLSRGLMAVRVDSLRDGRRLYALNDDKHVMPASNMKVVTLAAAVERLGWNFTYETRLESSGEVVDGVLRGDLIAVGGGDPSIASLDGGPAPLFGQWADALLHAGIHRVRGRLIGDDDFFDDIGLGAGWSWDDLGAGYAAPSGALSYNENGVTVRIRPGATPGSVALVDLAPPGHELRVENDVRTAATASSVDLDLIRLPGSANLTVRGTVPAGGPQVARSASVDNPTRFFVEGLRLALAARQIQVDGGAWDIDDVPSSVRPADRHLIAAHQSPPLSVLAGYFMKVSQNFYAETLLRTMGRLVAGQGTAAAGRTVVRDTLVAWGIPGDAIVMADGSGLSRYNYVTASAVITILERMWQDERFRGAFAAALPVAGHDGTLASRMKGTVLDARLEAKTGTISNVRALSGYLETRTGDRLAFSMIANHFTAPSSRIDAIVERALTRLADE